MKKKINIIRVAIANAERQNKKIIIIIKEPHQNERNNWTKNSWRLSLNELSAHEFYNWWILAIFESTILFFFFYIRSSSQNEWKFRLFLIEALWIYGNSHTHAINNNDITNKLMQKYPASTKKKRTANIPKNSWVF